MTEPSRVQVRFLTWDAQEMYPDGLREDCAKPEDLSELLESIAGAIATEGQVVVLPGPSPHQALVLAMDGTGDGYAITGSATPPTRP